MEYMIVKYSVFKNCCSELSPCAVGCLFKIKKKREFEIGVFGQLRWALGVLVIHCPRPGCQLPTLGSV